MTQALLDGNKSAAPGDPAADGWPWKAFLTALNLRRVGAFVLIILTLATGIATYTLFGESTIGVDDSATLLTVLYANMFLLLVFGVLVGRRVVKLWAERRRGLAGARLHARLVMLFGLVAITPAVLVSVFSLTFFDYGVREWFSTRVGTAIKSADAVANAYLEEHRETIKGQILLIANDLNQYAQILSQDPKRLREMVRAQSVVRNLPEVVVFDQAGKVMARSPLSMTVEFELFDAEIMDRAVAGEVVVIPAGADDKIRAMVRLNRLAGTYLLVGRYVDPDILAHVSETERAVAQYAALEVDWLDIQITFAMIFALASMLLLLLAIFVGLSMANRLARPVSALIAAAERLSAGDLSARIGPSGVVGELTILGTSFDNMAQQLEVQRHDLMAVNRQLDQRRVFTEAVLEGVSAGIIGLTPDGVVTLTNKTAIRLLAIESDRLMGAPLIDLVPEFADLMAARLARRGHAVEGEVVLRRGDQRINLFTRLTAEFEGHTVVGYVVTFDDISDLLSAQRVAAWADVARRIAHEIKNPLTPIQLAAERLKRKYAAQIENDPETFTECTETIVRQVDDIGRMVDEFSTFARMPAPKIAETDLAELMLEIGHLHENAHGGIAVTVEAGSEPVRIPCDPRQIRQAITNLVKNAAESIAARIEAGDLPQGGGRIVLRIARRRFLTVLSVEDNGRGLPPTDRYRLIEPYVTTREKGTGLGLAIVKKIMEDHGGVLKLRDRAGGGAIVQLRFPERESPAEDAPGAMMTKT